MAEWRRAEIQPEAYRQLPDQAARAAQYRFYWISGKGVLLFLTFTGMMIAGGQNVARHGEVWWLFLLPATTLAGLFWKGFPAFCRCPECKGRMTHRMKEARVRPSGRFFEEAQPWRSYLVCDRCRLYLFLGERGH